MRSPRLCLGVQLTVALSYEDTGLDCEERAGTECWPLFRVMADYEQVK